jgi:hypothetical protein
LLALSFPFLFHGHDVVERLSPFGDWLCRVSLQMDTLAAALEFATAD